MKKVVAVGVLSGALIIGGIVGASAVGTISADNDSRGKAVAVQVASQEGNGTADKLIGKEKAKQLALKIVNGKVESVELEDEGDRLYYEVEIERAGTEIEVMIDAYSGKSLGTKVDDDQDDNDDRDDDNDNRDDANDRDDKQSVQQEKKAEPVKKAAVASKAVTAEQAAAIAAAHVGGTIIEVERDEDDGRIVYEVELKINGGTAEVEVAAATGKILEVDKDLDDDRDDNDDDDHDDDQDDDDDDDDRDDDDSDDDDDDDRDED
ncbi:PepSY domain-containing protein [Paenibacillus chungangensis]|uniref:PepSY domain-containing protein n=1 Tax=Paenibacillus chungangensis TaxID=696535 RepID=A0ABW3HL84_9BACL